MDNREFVFIVYVSDIQKSVDFYTSVLDLKVSFESPRYVTMDLATGVSLALWTGRNENLNGNPVRTSEVCLNVSGGAEEILAIYEDWSHRGVTIVEKPYDDVFGKTFIAADPDGNLIRVAPVD